MKKKAPLVQLGSVAEIIMGQSPPGSSYNGLGEGLPFFQGKTEFSDHFIGDPVKWTTSATKIARAGDIVMSVRAPVGPVNLISQECCIGRGLAAIRPSDRLDLQYCFFFLRSKEKSIKGHGGAIFDSINKDTIGKIQIPLPVLSEQREIAARFVKAYELKEKREEADKKMAAFAPALFYQMFGDPGKNEKGWEVKKLGEITDVVAGSTPSSRYPDFWNGDINWVTPAEMKNESFYIIATARKITKQGFEDCSTKMFPQGSVILSTRAPIGKVAIAGVEMCSNQGIKALITKSCLNNIYLFWWLKQQTDYLNSLGSGATFKELSSTTLKSVFIPVPPLVLQEKFASYISEMRIIRERQTESRKKLEEVFGGVMSLLL